MLRTLTIALALALPAVAEARPAQTHFPQSAIGAEVRGVDGARLGEVTAVERNAEGAIVAVEIPGLEPEDAPRPAIVADASRQQPRAARQRDARAEAATIIRTSTAARQARTR